MLDPPKGDLIGQVYHNCKHIIGVVLTVDPDPVLSNRSCVCSGGKGYCERSLRQVISYAARWPAIVHAH